MQDNKINKIIIYQLQKECYSCGKITSLISYIKDFSNQDVIYPWDKKHLLENQDLARHIADPSIEYYGIKVLGADEKLDDLLMKRYPKRIKSKYSCTIKKVYPMNVCEHCGAKQGWYFLYRDVNEKIRNNEKIEILETIEM